MRRTLLIAAIVGLAIYLITTGQLNISGPCDPTPGYGDQWPPCITRES